VSSPVLTIVIGMAGSGKSTVAQRLAREQSRTYLDKDALASRFVEAALSAGGYAPNDRESNAFYRQHVLPLEYDSLLDVAGANLRLGHSVIVDAPFTPYLSDPNYISAAAQRLSWPSDVRAEVLHMRVAREELRQRLTNRALERDRWKLANWDEYWIEHGGRPCLWAGVHLTEICND
jgi:predicted kinase